MRQLVVMRHGTSDWDAGASDHERPLNGRGRDAADRMGRALTSAGLVPDHVVTSSAVRARTTAERVVVAGGWAAGTEVRAELYESDVVTTLGVLAQNPDVGRVLVVGHQPTWSALVARLTGGAVAMRTATVAVVDLLVRDWSEVTTAHGELLTVLQPRLLPDDGS